MRAPCENVRVLLILPKIIHMTNEQIEKFQILHKKLTGKELNFSEAHKQAESLVRMVELTYKPMTREEFIKIKKRKKEIEHRIIIQILTSYEIT